jgi:nicotinamide-nucleotide amidase
MNAQIITIGDELLIGQTINTNAAYIGNLLIDNQVKIRKTTVVGDESGVILREFKDAWENNDLIIVTGGLGPTHDDITLSCVVKFFDTTLVINEEVLEDVKKRFQRLNRQLTKVNEDQALVPAISTPIRNTRGTAPGCWIAKDNKYFVVMPGVPYEMKEMMNNFIVPKLKTLVSGNDYYIKKTTLLTTGIPESALFEKMGDIETLLNGAQLAFLPSPFGVKLRVTVTEPTKAQTKAKLADIEQKIRSIAGRYIYGKDEDDLAEVVGRLLRERNLSIAVAESCTGGNISNNLTNFSGSSEFFERGIVSYSNAAKVEILNVDEDTIGKYGAVSYEVARQMAEGVKKISGTDIGLAITGILGPTGGSPEKPVGIVFIGYCDNTVCTAIKFQFGDDRILNKQRATQSALAILRKALLGIPLDA